jgi:hypothetical protein
LSSADDNDSVEALARQFRRARGLEARAEAIGALMDVAVQDESASFDALLRLLELAQDGKLMAEELEPHGPRLLALWCPVRDNLNAFQGDRRTDEYRPVRSLAGLMLDLMGHLPGDALGTALHQALTLDDARLRMFAATSLLRRLELVGQADLDGIASSHEARILLWQRLCELEMADLMPGHWARPEQLAASDLACWVSHPRELNAAPEEIELMLRVPVQYDSEDLDAYLFRFRQYPKPWEEDSGWLAGVAGPFQRGKPVKAPFSCFDPWDALTPEDHFEKLFLRGGGC